MSTSTTEPFLSRQIQGDYVVGGTGLRNLGYGDINIEDIPLGGVVEDAYLYWMVLADEEKGRFATGTVNGVAVEGNLVSSGADPCWGNTRNFLYRARVSELISGNGSYSLDGFSSGQTDGSDPWEGDSVPPMLEGASLVVLYRSVGSEAQVVQLYEDGRETHGRRLEMEMGGFRAKEEGVNARTTFIGADGQAASEPGSTFNGVTVPSVEWDGEDPQAVPDYSRGNLWDTSTLDVSQLIDGGSTESTATVEGGPDCLVWAVQVLSVTGSESKGQVEFGQPQENWVINDNCRYGSKECAVSGSNHTGVDSVGSPRILSMGPGVVSRVQENDGTDAGFGNAIFVEHELKNGETIYSMYAHMSSVAPDIEPGMCIGKGKWLGIMGSSGYGDPIYWTRRYGIDNEHLHLELKVDDVLGDPETPNRFFGYIHPSEVSGDAHPDAWGYDDPEEYVGQKSARQCE